METTTRAPHTHDIVDMIAAGDYRAAAMMHAAYVTAEYEREDLSGHPANTLDMWLAGAILEAVSECPCS